MSCLATARANHVFILIPTKLVLAQSLKVALGLGCIVFAQLFNCMLPWAKLFFTALYLVVFWRAVNKIWVLIGSLPASSRCSHKMSCHLRRFLRWVSPNSWEIWRGWLLVSLMVLEKCCYWGSRRGGQRLALKAHSSDSPNRLSSSPNADLEGKALRQFSHCTDIGFGNSRSISAVKTQSNRLQERCAGRCWRDGRAAAPRAPPGRRPEATRPRG